ncbi:MAG: alpha/beta hydrolase [Gammaproteobacteria bacterium]|nr:alpha/beta hydrolase [Gammaproteobacteria bacterium]
MLHHHITRVSLWLTMACALLLTGCSSNRPFYAPASETFRTTADYRHPYQDLWLASGSGNLMHVQRHFTNAGHSQGVVLHFHGNRGNLSDTIVKVEWLLDEGYDLVVFDYSGYGNSSGTPTPATTFEDARTLLDWFNRLPRQDADYRKVVIGESLGGAILVSGLAAPLAPLDLDLVVVDSSFHSYVALARSVAADHLLGWTISWAAPLVISDDYAAGPRMAQLPAAPLLISHCDSDSLIPHSFSEQLFQAARGNKVMWSLPGCAHARGFGNEYPLNQQLLLTVIDQPSRLTAEYDYAAALALVNNQSLLLSHAGR